MKWMGNEEKIVSYCLTQLSGEEQKSFLSNVSEMAFMIWFNDLCDKKQISSIKVL
jgi:hypothetical protein